MNDKRPTPDVSAGRRKRTAPTIDLEAEEVRSAEAASESAAPAAEAQAAAEDEALSQAAAEAAASSEPGSAPSDDDVRKTERPSPIVPAVVGGLVGAAAIALIGVIAWTAGLLPSGGSTQADPRVAALESQLKELQGRAAAPSNNAAANDALNARIGKLEGEIQKLSSLPEADNKALGDRVAANDNAMKSLGVALTALNRRYDELAASTRDAQTRAEAAEKTAADLRGDLQTVSRAASAGASSADLAPLQQRIATLEDQTKNANAELARTTRSERAARLALSTAALRDAVLRGVPFAEELAQAKALGADEKSLAPLWPLAAGGVPTAKDLGRELNDLLPQLQKAVGSPAASGSFLDRLQANAESLVRIRPAGAPPGDDTPAIMARLETDAVQGNIDAALGEIGKLPEAARQKASGWVARAMARQKALAAARDLAADSTRSLGSR